MPSFDYSVLVLGHQTVMHKRDVSGRPSKILNSRIFVPAESKLSNSGKGRDNYGFWGLHHDPLVVPVPQMVVHRIDSGGCSYEISDLRISRPGESIRLRILAYSSDRRSQKELG